MKKLLLVLSFVFIFTGSVLEVYGLVLLKTCVSAIGILAFLSGLAFIVLSVFCAVLCMDISKKE